MADDLEKRLARYAGNYLQRYFTSRAHLRMLMVRYLRRISEDDLPHGEELIDPIMDKLVRMNLIDDVRFATDKAAALHRRGASTAMIRVRLAEKRLDSDVIQNAIDELGEAAEREAARTYARKRRLGQWGNRPEDPVQRRRDLAKLARCGFSYHVAIDALTIDE
jgi:regulatory protein